MWIYTHIYPSIYKNYNYIFYILYKIYKFILIYMIKLCINMNQYYIDY